MKLTVPLLLLLCIVLVGCRLNSSSYSRNSASEGGTPSNSGQLTTEKAQNAVDQFATANNYQKVRITSGIQEIPAQNAAVADISIEGKVTARGGRYGEGRGKVVFTRYNDGRWFLTGFSARIPSYNPEGTLTGYQNPDLRMNIEVR